MSEAAYGHIQVLLPTLDGANFFLQIRRDLLPGVEALVRRPVRHHRVRLCAVSTHRPSLQELSLRSGGKNLPVVLVQSPPEESQKPGPRLCSILTSQ